MAPYKFTLLGIFLTISLPKLIFANTAEMMITEPWSGQTLNDLWNEYGNIFRHGNRNAASQLWASFLLNRSRQMSPDTLVMFFNGFCAVSGSIVRPSDYTRYRLTLDSAFGSGSVTGFMNYCCWPCVCDTQDFIKVDTKTVDTAHGPRKFMFAVIGNPCRFPEKLHEPFVQPFDQRSTTIAQEAAEVRCGADGELLGATLSDHGHIIISMFFEPTEGAHAQGSSSALTAYETRQLATTGNTPTPGRISQSSGVSFQDEFEFSLLCRQREEAGFNSGMGEIFRKVAAINIIGPPRVQSHSWLPIEG